MKLNISIYTLRVAFRARRNWLPVEYNIVSTPVPCVWQPSGSLVPRELPPAGHGDTAGLGHCWLLILLSHPRGAISAQSALHQVTWPSSAPGPISTQLPANGFTVTVTPVNTIIYHTLHQFQGIGNNREGCYTHFSFTTKRLYVTSVAKIQNLLYIQYNYLTCGLVD